MREREKEREREREREREVRHLFSDDFTKHVPFIRCSKCSPLSKKKSEPEIVNGIKTEHKLRELES